MQHRRVQVVDGDLFLDRLEAELIGGSVDYAGLDPTASQPHGEAVRIVVSAIALFGDRRAPELAAPDNERLIQQPATFRVTDQRGRGAVHIGAAPSEAFLQVLVVVPLLARPVVHLDVTDAAFDQPSRQQAAIGVRRRSVFGPDRLRFFAVD